MKIYFHSNKLPLSLAKPCRHKLPREASLTQQAASFLQPFIPIQQHHNPPSQISRYYTMKAVIAVPITLAMVYRSWSHKSLTPAGIVAAVLTAAAHAVHPWNLPYALLIVFFLAGTRVTKVWNRIFFYLCARFVLIACR